jgi:hypothetical protein
MDEKRIAIHVDIVCKTISEMAINADITIAEILQKD